MGAFLPPSYEFPLGIDEILELGRFVASRVILLVQQVRSQQIFVSVIGMLHTRGYKKI